MRRDIQGLRALAVIAVVLDHAFAWPRGGFVGVDVFFVVSGFLITALLLREVAETGRISLGRFLARRVRRILPAALVVLTAVVGAAFVVLSRTRAEETLADAAAALLSLANWRFVAEGTDYFAAASTSVLQHFWSLSVEEQFYLVWPVLLLGAVLLVPARRRRARGGIVVGAMAGAVVIVSFAWALMQSTQGPTTAYFSTATRAWELAAGALLAAVLPLLARIPRALGALMGWAGLAGVVWSFFTVDPTATPFPGPGAAVPVLATALVVAGGVAADPRGRHLFPITHPVAVFIGDISYSLYLWHLPVLVFAAVLLPGGGPTAAAITVATMLALALASYAIVEQPLHRSPLLRRRQARGAGTTDDPGAVEAAAAIVEGGKARVAGARADAAEGRADAADAAPVAPRVLQSRPAGWTPGTRYYPGSPRTSTAASAGTDTTAAGATATATPTATAAGTPAVAGTPPSSASVRSASDAAASITTMSDTAAFGMPTAAAAASSARTETSWAAWRARFAPQMGFSALGLVVVTGLIVLTVQHTSGAPLFDVAPIAEDATPSDDPVSALQSDLAEAVTAASWPALSPSMDTVMAASSADNAARECFSPGIPLDASGCRWGSVDAPEHLYLVGDSIAMAYAPAFRKMAEDSGGALRVTTVGMYGCRFTDVLVYNPDPLVMAECAQRKQTVREMIAADGPQIVVVANAFTLGHTVDDRDLSAADLAAATAAESAGYGAAGTVMYLAPPPTGADLGRCYSPLSSPAACLSAVDSTWHDMADATAATAAATGSRMIDSLPFTCVGDVCPAFAGSVPTRYDPTHLTVAYAERLAPVLRRALFPPAAE